jgi:hypothetical protein
MLHGIRNETNHAAEDFYTVQKIAALTGYAVKSLYNQHAAGVGPLGNLLTKVGGKLLMSRADYEAWRDRQRKLKDAA